MAGTLATPEQAGQWPSLAANDHPQECVVSVLGTALGMEGWMMILGTVVWELQAPGNLMFAGRKLGEGRNSKPGEGPE